MILANFVLCALLPSYLSPHIQAWSDMAGNNSTSIDSPKDAKNVNDMQYTTIQSINQTSLQITIIQRPLSIVLGSLFANKVKRSQSMLIQQALWSESKWDFSQFSQK